MTTFLRIATVVLSLVTLTLAVLAFLGRADLTWTLASMAVMLGLLVLWQQKKPKTDRATGSSTLHQP